VSKGNTNNAVVANCLNCKNVFQLKRYWQKCCSYKCGYEYQNKRLKQNRLANTNLCYRCGKSLLHKRTNAIYCSQTCKSMDHNFKHRNGSGRRTTTARRRLIIERDNGICYLCNKQIPFNEIEIDHLIPRSRGGSSQPDNLSVSCMKCNRHKGNRIGLEQLKRLFELRPLSDY